MSYNLLEEEWIPILGSDGKASRVGIKEALTEAGRIRQIAASNPMDRVAILRFLLAVLHWCKPNLTEAERAKFNDHKSIPDQWLEKLGTENNPNEAFNLLGDTVRFYQDRGLRGQSNMRPIGDLLQEFPTETKIAHFRHVRDKNYGLCPACCAMGVVRFCTFGNYAGKGYTSHVNGPAPAYAIAQGETLLQTLLLNWPMQAAQKREPPWLCDRAPSQKDLDPPTVFAWRSRRLWLGDLEKSGQPCSYCGQLVPLIKQLAFTGGWPPPFASKGKQKKFWDQDPHLIFEARKKRKDESDEDLDEAHADALASNDSLNTKPTESTTIGFPRVGARVVAHVRFWRRALAAVRSHSAATKAIIVAGPAASQTGMLYQDAAALTLPPVSNDAASATRDVANFLTSVTQKLIGLLRQSTPNPQRQHPNRKATLEAHSPSLETGLREEFDNWLRNPVPPTGTTPPPVELWRDRLFEHLRPVVEAVVAATTPGSPLRRREAAIRAQEALHRAIAKSEESDMKEAQRTEA